MANKRSKVTSHQKQTNNASEKPLDSIETLIAMPRSEFSENQLARNSIVANNKSSRKNNLRLCQQVFTCTWLTVSLRNRLAAISRKSANSCLCWHIPGRRGRWCHRCHRCPCPFLGGCLSSTWGPHLFQRLHDFLKLSVHALAHQWGSALEKTSTVTTLGPCCLHSDGKIFCS